ncbi:polysaccharide lyase 6 family protein [Botryobacter ruber]|uniref:polysaccharide lyase 6 family protein n=1 Tax=Botryobacter ruber TaxID=2171629 RepID=UPI000E0B8117|nr:polysaccharide lyase 6 family protein [Botryobacter ruber]
MPFYKTQRLNISRFVALLLITSIQLLVIGTFVSCSRTGTNRHGNTVHVKNISELTAAMAAAQPGDQLVMADGTWQDAVIDFNATATEAAPITLKAQTPGKVILTGSSKLTFSKPYLIADGLLFQNGIPASGNVIDFKTNHCRLTNTAVVDYNPPVSTQGYYWVFFSGSHNQVENCYFKGKNNNQPLIGNDQDDSRYNKVNHCYFKDIPYSNVNGREIFRIWGYGRSEELGDDGGFFTIEYNLFERAHGEGTEIISFKSNHNVARYNTIIATRGGITGRSGNYNTVEGNFILGQKEQGTSGIRMAGQGHKVLNNYIADVTGDGLTLMTGEYIEKDLTGNYKPILREGTPLGRVPSYGHVRNGMFAHNTFLNVSGTDMIIGSSYKASWNTSQRILIPESNTVANNLVVKAAPGGGIAVTTPTQDKTAPLDIFRFEPNTYEGNVIYRGTVAISPEPSGFRYADPQLTADAYNIFRPATNSPAADAGVRVVTATATNRKYDTGTPQAGIQRPLTPKDVGPAWMR